VTLVFAVLDGPRIRPKLFADFDPRKLKPGIWSVRAASLSPIPRRDTVFELATLTILTLWWIGWPFGFGNVLPPGVAIEPGSVFTPLYWPVVALCVADLLRLCGDFAYAYRTRARVALRLALNIAWLFVFVSLFRADELDLFRAVAVGAEATPESAAGVAVIVAIVLRTVLFVLATITAALIATDVVRLVRR
jgi:hypothetical protein